MSRLCIWSWWCRNSKKTGWKSMTTWRNSWINKWLRTLRNTQESFRRFSKCTCPKIIIASWVSVGTKSACWKRNSQLCVWSASCLNQKSSHNSSLPRSSLRPSPKWFHPWTPTKSKPCSTALITSTPETVKWMIKSSLSMVILAWHFWSLQWSWHELLPRLSRTANKKSPKLLIS